MDEPDPQTVRAAAAGDHAAFAAIVRTTQPHVWRFLRHLLGDPDVAADVTQETFVRVHRSLRGFRHESRFTTWLLRIARNAAVDEQRRQIRRRRALRVEDVQPPTPDGSLSTELRAAMADLPAALREPFVLVEVFGMKYREVAEVLGVPEGTVKSRVFRARAELVAWLRAGSGDLGDLGEGGAGDA
jgi:RNA polymerase sigma-70 factor, ECF subfamily